MKKPNLFTSLHKIGGGLVLCIVVFLLASCENFLKSQNVKQEIEDAIAYNNAMSSTLIFRAANGEGDFLTGNEKSCKLGYTIDVQFSVNVNDFVFKGLEAVSSFDKAVSRSDYVEFTDIGTEREKSNGVYKIQIKLLKQSDDILIRPVCILVPQIKQITPEYSRSGCEQDTSIIIEFNKPINPETFNPECISIKNGEEELFSTNPAESFFEAPRFSSNNTILTIPTVKGKYIIPLLPAGQKSKDLTLTIVSSQIKDEDGLSLHPVEPYTYRINQSVDSQKPLIDALSAANTSDKTNPSYKTLTDKATEEWSSAPEYEADGKTIKFLNGDYSHNHISDTVHLNIIGYDKDSGIKCVKVHQIYEKTSDGLPAINEEEENIFGTGQFVYIQNSDNLYEYSFDYKFSPAAKDGLYKLEISIIDKAENESTALTYYVIKDAALQRKLKWLGYLDVTHTFKNPQGVDIVDYSITEDCFPQYKETTGKYESKFQFHYFNFFENSFYSSYKTLCKKLLIQQCNSNNEYVTVFEENNLSNNDEADVDNRENVLLENIITKKINKALNNLVIDPDTTTKFKVVLYEETGTVNEYPFAIAKRPRVINHDIDDYRNLKLYMEELDYFISSDISVSLSNERGILGKKADTDSEISSYRRFGISTSDDTDCQHLNQQNTTYYISFARKAETDFGEIYSAYGKPYILYRNGGEIDWVNSTSEIFNEHIYNPSKIKNFNFPTFSLPELNEQNIENGKLKFPPNSGKVCCTIDITYPKDGYEYLFKILQNGRKLIGISSSNTIEIENGKNYSISLVARNSDGIIVAESEPQKKIYQGPDNIPPVVIEPDSYLSSYKDYCQIKRNNLIDYDPASYTSQDDGTRYLTLEYDRVASMTCYFGHTLLGNNVTQQDLENANYVKYTLKVPKKASGSTIKIPLYFLDQGKYYVYCYLEDVEGNRAIYRYETIKNVPISIGSYTIPVLPEYTLKNTDTTYMRYGSERVRKDLFSLTFPKYSEAIKPAADAYTYDPEYRIDLEMKSYKLNATSNTWNEGVHYAQELERYSGALSEDDENYTLIVSEPNDNNEYNPLYSENMFYKVEVLYGYYSNDPSVFLYTIYFYKGSDGYDYTCRNKSVMDSYNGYQIFCDKPAFAHTMFSKFKLSETSSPDDSHIWEARGIETGLVYNDASAGTFSYTDENFEDIPTGCYYTTIFHFVDGTTVMTPVKQK